MSQANRKKLIEQRSKINQKRREENEKKKKERVNKIGGSARAYYKNNPGSNTGNKTNKKSIKKVDKHRVMQTRIKVGKRLIKKDSVEGRKILKSLKIRKKAAK